MIKKVFYTVLIVVLLFIGLSRFLTIGEGGLERAVSYMAYPFLKMQKSISSRVAHWQFHRGSATQIARQLEQAMQHRDALQQEVIHLKSLINLKEVTQDVRSFLERYNTDSAVLCQVLLKNFDKNHFFLLDAGEKKGIVKDMIAVYKDCLVGRVTEVYPSYCKIVLITDPACKVAAVATSNSVKGIHEGAGSLESNQTFLRQL